MFQSARCSNGETFDMSRRGRWTPAISQPFFVHCLRNRMYDRLSTSIDQSKQMDFWLWYVSICVHILFNYTFTLRHRSGHFECKPWHYEPFSNLKMTGGNLSLFQIGLSTSSAILADFFCPQPWRWSRPTKQPYLKSTIHEFYVPLHIQTLQKIFLDFASTHTQKKKKHQKTPP